MFSCSTVACQKVGELGTELLTSLFLDQNSLTFTCYFLVVLLESITFIFNCYADDTELYLSIKPKESDQFVKLHTSLNDIKSWKTLNFLMVQMVSLLCIILL